MSNPRWIWPFEILEQIGEGGMGVVYRARYVVNGRQVALKMLPGDISDKTALARFEREVDVLKTMKHENIVRCFGGVCEDKRRFYAMELLEGGSLEEQLVAKGKLPWELVVQYGLQMCAALEYSHSKGVVHRDVKPSNFLISPTGQLKLSDFGLASVTSSRKITAAGKTAGTFLYMAPEQIRGLEVTPRTDLYALGCVLYELVTGQVPFIGDTPGATLHLHCSATPVRPTEKAFDCPLQLEKIILKLLEKDPDHRYQTAAEVASELRAISQAVTVTSVTAEGPDHLIGTDVPTRPAIAAQKSTNPYPVPLPVPSSRFILTLAALLLGSTIWNFYQWERVAALAPAQRHWEESLQNGPPEIRRHAAQMMGKMAEQNSRNLKVLRKELENSDPERRIAAALGLLQAGHAGTGVVPQLIKMQKEDADPAVRDAAAAAVVGIRDAQPTSSSHRFRLILGILLVMATVVGTIYVLRPEQA